MALTEKILQHIQSLPESLQAEVLNFIEYLESKAEKGKEGFADIDWSTFSLSAAMRGMEDEHSPYSMEDLKEIFS